MNYLDRDEILADKELVASALNTGDSKQGFFNAIYRLQSVPLFASGAEFSVQHSTLELDAFLLKHKVLTESEVKESRSRTKHSALQQSVEMVSCAIGFLESIDPVLSSVVRECIANVVIMQADEKEGGSVSSAIGMIYLAPKESWMVDFWGEMMLHESIHNRLFLLDMVRTLFPDLGELEKQEGMCISAIRKVRRPFDKSFHSACVSSALVRYYNGMGKPDAVEALLRPLQASIRDLRAAYERCNACGIRIATSIVGTLFAIWNVPTYDCRQDSQQPGKAPFTRSAQLRPRRLVAD